MADVAAFGVPSDLTEDDVMVAVAPRPGRTIQSASLLDYCRARMTRYMVPRYIEVVSDLPRTPTEKVEKLRLAARGVTANTWDSDIAARHSAAGTDGGPGGLGPG